MKKSVLFVLLGIIVYIGILAATNLKLRNEYMAGNYANTYVKILLPSFSYLKEDFNPAYGKVDMNSGANGDKKCIINVLQADSNSIFIDSTIKSLIDFSVRNDTLILKQSAEALKGGRLFLYPVTIYTKQLKGVIASRNLFNIKRLTVDSLEVVANDRSQINLEEMNVNNLVVYGERASGIRIEATDSIQNATITLTGKSSFSAGNLVILNRKLYLGDSSILRLSGKSIRSFGIE